MMITTTSIAVCQLVVKCVLLLEVVVITGRREHAVVEEEIRRVFSAVR